MRIFSIGTLWSCFIAALFVTLAVFPGFCYLGLSGKAIVFGFAIVFMGWYQLSRLHYCFSNEQIHNRNGYPLSLFIVLIAFGPILLIDYAVVYVLAYPLPSDCGFKSDFITFREYSDYIDYKENKWFSTWFLCQFAAGWTWDISTLALYGFKIWKIGKIYKSKHEEIWKNVLSILDRVTILTIFYLFCYLIAALIVIQHGFTDDDELYLVMSSLVNVMCSTAVSTSMYLMMEHNTEEYIALLLFLRDFHLKYLCFCCWFHKLVDRQLAVLLIGKESKGSAGSKSPSEKKANNVEKRDTITDTHHVGSAHIAYGVKDNRISVPTMTIIREDHDSGQTAHKTIVEHSV